MGAGSLETYTLLFESIETSLTRPNDSLCLNFAHELLTLYLLSPNIINNSSRIDKMNSNILKIYKIFNIKNQNPRILSHLS